MKQNNFDVWLLLGTALIFRLCLSFFGTLWLDMNAWIGWSNRIFTVGFKDFYNSWCDYLPSYLYVLWFWKFLQNNLLVLGISLPAQVFYKLPSILADLGTGYLIYKFLAKKKPRLGLLALIFWLFNPAVWINSSLWGQADSFFSFFLVLSFYLFRAKNYLLTALVLAFASLIKPLGFLLLPFYGVILLKEKNYYQIFKSGLVFLIVSLLLFVPFTSGNFWGFIWARFSQTLGQYPYSSLNAFNFWGVLGKMWVSDQQIRWLGMIIFGLVYIFCLTRAYFRKTDLYRQSFLISVIFWAAFLFLTRMHERHLFYMFPFLVLAAAEFSSLWIVYFLSSAVYTLNLYYAFVWLNDDFHQVLNTVSTQVLSLINLACFIASPFLLKKIKFKLKLKPVKPWLNFKSQVVLPRKSKLIYPIIIFAFLTRLLGSWYPQAFVFDEVYHAFTAQRIVASDPKAWEWWNTPPQGFAYEWTHPPLAKLFMAGGIIVTRNLGITNDFFGWRLPAVFFGTGVIYLVYLLARRLANDETVSLLAAFLLSLDGLTLVMSRIGMNDIYFLFFGLLSIILAWDKKWFWAGLSWGLALSCKWTGMYLAVPLLILFASQHFKKKKNFTKWLGVLVIVGLVYLASYFVFFRTGHNFKKFQEVQQQMWWYHTQLKATHNYQSTPILWLFDIRPVWFYVNYQGEKIGNIYALGNPLIFWLGLAVLPLFVWELWQKKSFNQFFLLVCYLIFWLPWAFSPRIMFLYHYLPSVPFLVIILSWQAKEIIWLFKRKETILLLFSGLIFSSFVFLLPLWTGILLPKNILTYFFWLPTWK